ncbi:MAG: DUF4032 domain-containing protein, partial [Actinobacteria bacterium]|nr:DUF4032 domain-containing protein [Actinomycetota bacterium]
MHTPRLTIRSGHPDFLDLPWESPMLEWGHPRRMELPKGISRHEVQFFGYDEGIYAIKELPLPAARQEYTVMRALEDLEAPSVIPVGLVERPWLDPGEETSAAVITVYLNHAFSYRELLSGTGFGQRRNQMLDAFAGLLVELHLIGCYWGDCSLSNVLYRYDADAIDVTMVDGETAEIRDRLSDGQRLEDIEIMVVNVAGGMADIAAASGVDIDEADLALGEDIAERYHALWAEVTGQALLGPGERYLIRQRIERVNALGFEVGDLDLEPTEGGTRLRLHLAVTGRNYHSHRLRHLTGVDASENQARQILSDLHYFEMGRDVKGSDKAIAAIRWRVEVFEPLLARIRALEDRR